MNMIFPNCRQMTLLLLLLVAMLSGCVHAPSALRIDNFPMYGQPEIIRSESMLKLDEQFIQDAIAGIGTREAASDTWWAQAEVFMARGNLDFAMRRYNQSWLLNKQSFKPYWGFARVLLERGEVVSAIAQLEKAISLCTDDFQRPALLADAGSAYSIQAFSAAVKDRALLYGKADAMFEQAVKLDPSYGNAYKQWALSLYRQENYREAWLKVAEARKRRDTTISPVFLKSLENKMPEPKL
jgi:tetratricopeptide (TPR) repeat protein